MVYRQAHQFSYTLVIPTIVYHSSPVPFAIKEATQEEITNKLFIMPYNESQEGTIFHHMSDSLLIKTMRMKERKSLFGLLSEKFHQRRNILDGSLPDDIFLGESLERHFLQLTTINQIKSQRVNILNTIP